MKLSLALGERRPLSRQTAWGCLTSNLALPGLGSLVAGYASGYPQVALGLAGLVLTMVFGVRTILWYLANWSRLQEPADDPLARLIEIWKVSRWALLGIAVFAVGLLWALATSMKILRDARNAERAQTPPRIL